MPLMVVVHPKQTHKVKGIVLWDHAFANLERVPFEFPNKVSFAQLSTLLQVRCLATVHATLQPCTLPCNPASYQAESPLHSSPVLTLR